MHESELVRYSVFTCTYDFQDLYNHIKTHTFLSNVFFFVSTSSTLFMSEVTVLNVSVRVSVSVNVRVYSILFICLRASLWVWKCVEHLERNEV